MRSRRSICRSIGRLWLSLALTQHERQQAGHGSELTDPEEKRPAEDFNAKLREALLHLEPQRRQFHIDAILKTVGCRSQAVVEAVSCGFEHVVPPSASLTFCVLLEISCRPCTQPFAKGLGHGTHSSYSKFRRPASHDDDAIVCSRCQRLI